MRKDPCPSTASLRMLRNLYLRWMKSIILGSEKTKFMPTKLNQKERSSDNHYNPNCMGKWQGYGGTCLLRSREPSAIWRHFRAVLNTNKILSQHRVLSTVTRKRAGRWGVRLRMGQGIPLLSKFPPNLLFSRYQGLLPRGKATGDLRRTVTSVLRLGLRNTGAIPLHPLYVFLVLTEKTYPYIYL